MGTGRILTPVSNPTFCGPKYAPKSSWLCHCNDFIDAINAIDELIGMVNERDFLIHGTVVKAKHALFMSNEQNGAAR